MSKKTIILFTVFYAIFIAGCAKCSDRSPAAIRIGSISATAADFEEAYRNSFYAVDGSAASRREFLDSFITRKLILKEAERMGLDKDPEFLKSVEFFWQQSLVKLTLDRKIRQLCMDVKVNDREVKDFYEAHKDSEFKGKDINAVYDEVKWLVLNKKHNKVLDAWIESLKSSSKADIDYKALGIKQ